MGPSIRIALTLILACSILRICDAAEPIATEPDKDYVHGPSDVHFPPKVNTFQRERVLRYDTAGLDISTGYNDADAMIAMTVYVFPTHGASTRARFDGIVSEVQGAHRDARIVQRGIYQMRQKNKKSYDGFNARFRFAGLFAGKQQDVCSDAYLIRLGDKQFVEYRVTYPADAEDRVRSLISKFMGELALP